MIAINPALLRVWWIPKAAAPLRSSKEPHMMAFGVTNLGVVLVPYPPNSGEGPLLSLRVEGAIITSPVSLGVRLQASTRPKMRTA